MNSLLTLIAAAVSAALTGGAAVAMINAIAGRRSQKAEVAERLSDGALKWVQEFQEETASARREASEARQETASARREAAEARQELADMRREMQVVRAEAEALAAHLHSIRSAILAPAATIEQLRLLVGGAGPGLNGNRA